MPRVSPEVRARQLAETEEAITKLRSTFRVVQHLCAKWKIGPRTAERWIADVRKRWRDEATAAPVAEIRETRRDKMRASLEMAQVECMLRTQVVKNEDGTVVLDEREFIRADDGTQRPNPQWKKPLTRPFPDIQRFIHAANALRHLDGLDEPAKLQIEHTGFGESLPDVDKIPEAARAKMREALAAMSPDGDLRKLAGDLFAASARSEKLN